MPKKTTKKNTKGTKVVASKKVETKKDSVKNVPEKKVEVKEVITKKKGNRKAVISEVMNNTPFVIALCAVVLLIAALIFTLCMKRVPKISKTDEVVATVNGEKITLDNIKEMLLEEYGEDADIYLLKSDEDVIATIKGKEITTNDLYFALKETYGKDALIDLIDTYIIGKEVEITDKNKEYVDEVVDYYKEYAEYYGVDLATFLANYVGLSGIKTEKEFYNYVLEDYKKTLAVTNYVGENATEEDLKKYYKENYSDKLTVKHILIEVDSEEKDTKKAEKEAYNKAMDLIEELNDTSSKKLDSKFEKLAEDNSDDTATYSKGGLIEDFTKTDVVKEFWEASEKLENGKYTSEPVKSEYGYHIILKVSSTPVEKYKDIKEDVRFAYAESLLAKDSTLFAAKWDELRSQYKLSIKDDFIKIAYKKALKEATKKTEQKTEE